MSRQTDTAGSQPGGEGPSRVQAFRQQKINSASAGGLNVAGLKKDQKDCQSEQYIPRREGHHFYKQQ
jgi:hypothetical protein